MINRSSKTNTTKTMARGYQVAPARGMLLDWRQPDLDYAQLQDAQQRQAIIAQKNAQAEATRAMLNQQEGYGADITPERVQAFGGEKQRQNLAGAQELRTQGTYDDAGRFAAGINAGPAPDDPYLRQLHGTQTRLGAGQLADLQGKDYGRQGEFDNRTQMNEADNQSAYDRAVRLAEIQQGAKTDEREQERGWQQEDTQDMKAAMVKAYQTGDPTDVLARYPQLANSEEFTYAMDQARERNAAFVKAEEDKQQAIIDAKLGKGSGDSDKRLAEAQAKVQAENPPYDRGEKIPNSFFDERVVSPRHENDTILQKGYDNLMNMTGFVPKTIWHGSQDAGYKAMELLDELRKNIHIQ